MKSALSVVQKYHPNVTKVVDGKQHVTITVTERDCKNAKRKAPDQCALATACEREYDGAIISLSTAYLIKGNVAERYKVPTSIAREIVSFDRHHDFAAGDYWLNAPTTSERLGPRNRPQYVKQRKPKYDTHKRRYHRTSGIRSLG